MAYIINQDIIDRVGTKAALQLTTDSGSVIDTTKLDEVRLSAEGEVNGYLARRYAVPVDLTANADLTDVLKAFTLDVAVYRLHVRRGPVSESDSAVYQDARKWLMGVAKGDIVLPSATPPASTGADDPTGNYGSTTANLSTMRDSL